MSEAGTQWQLAFENVELRCRYLLTSELLSDCTFVVRSETKQEVILRAHKLVLAMSSPVFEAMFYGGLSERNEPIVTIPDVQPEVFKALLRYVYTGYINIGSFDMACNLWYGAKKYMLPHLAKECNNYICSWLVPRNACRAYELARLFDEKDVIEKCIQIISTNTKEVLNDRSFEDVELNTLITVLSLDHLNVTSELELFHAVARYAKAGQRTKGQIFKRLKSSNEKVLLNVESSSRTTPAVERDSKPPTEVIKPQADKEYLKDVPEEELPIRAAIKKIRFLSLTTQQFEEGPACSDLLTEIESFAVLMNIASSDSAVPMPTGFSECRERRQPPSDSVGEEPNDKPRPKLGFVATVLPTPAEIVRGLESRERETLESATRAARQMTCDDNTSENITQLVAAGGLPLLLAALHQPWSGVQYNATWALTNIACVGKYANEIVFGGDVSKVIALLGHGGVVAEQAAWALGNIGRVGDPARNEVVRDGAGPALLAYMLPTTPTKQLATYMWAYRVICQNVWISDSPPSTKFESVSYAVQCIGDLLVLSDERILAEACWNLYHLAYNAQIGAKAYTPSLGARLTALLETGAPRVQAAALAAVGSMLARTDLYATRAAFFILNGAPLHNQHAIDNRLLDALGLVLTEGDDKCKLIAARVISDFCAKAADWKLSVLASHATLQPYCRLVAADTDTDTSISVLRGLFDLLKNFKPNARHDLCLKLREIGVPELLLTWQQDKREWNCNIAFDLLRIYFRDE